MSGRELPGSPVWIIPPWPFFSNFYYSLMKWDGVNEPVFVGLENFIELFTDDRRMKESFLFTVKYLVVTVAAMNVLALLTALALDTKIKSRNILRTMFFRQMP